MKKIIKNIIALAIMHSSAFAATAEQEPVLATVDHVTGDVTFSDKTRMGNGSFVAVANPTQKNRAISPANIDKLKKGTDAEKKEIADALNAELPTKRILSCCGGGAKGLLPAIELAYLEEIFNDSLNAKVREGILKSLGREADKDQWLYISDLFDCGGGTSTGSILSAAYFYNVDRERYNVDVERYKAIEVAQIYVRYGFKIFEDPYNAVMKNQYVKGAKKLTVGGYSSKSFEGLLTEYMGGNIPMKDAFANKHVYIYGVYDDHIVRFSSCHLQDPLNTQSGYNLQGIYLCTALRASSAAPTFFSAQAIITTTHGTIFVTDGGTTINNPAFDIYQMEKSSDNKMEIYSFGTGKKKSAETSLLSELFAQLTSIEAKKAGNVLLKTMKTTEIDALRQCLLATLNKDESAHYFAHINPVIEDGMELDSTDYRFVERGICLALKETESHAFKSMVAQLGFQLPKNPEILKNHMLQKINAIQTNILTLVDDKGEPTYQRRILTEYIERKILSLDSKFFIDHEISTIDKDGTIKTIQDISFVAFLNNFKGETGNATVKQYIEFILTTKQVIEKLTPLTQYQWNKILNDAANMNYAKEALSASAQTSPINTFATSVSTLATRISSLLSSTNEPTPSRIKEKDIPNTTSHENFDFSDQNESKEPVASNEPKEPVDNNILYNFLAEFRSFCDNVDVQNSTDSKAPIAAAVYLNAKLNGSEFVTLEDLNNLYNRLGELISFFQNQKHWGSDNFLSSNGNGGTRYAYLIEAVKLKIDEYSPASQVNGQVEGLLERVVDFAAAQSSSTTTKN